MTTPPDLISRSVQKVATELADAEMELATLEQAFDNYLGNNPNKYRTDLRNARAQVKVLKEELKRRSTAASAAQS